MHVEYDSDVDEVRVDGQRWERVRPLRVFDPQRDEHLTNEGVRRKYVSPDNAFILKRSHPGATMQAQAEAEMWDEIKDTDDACFFVPILQHGFLNDGSDYSISPYIDFPEQVFDTEHTHVAKALAKRYGLWDFCRCQWKVTTDNTLKIHDYQREGAIS